MESPLWIDRHAPDIDGLPQSHVRAILREAAEEPLNLLLHGPAGAGKTAAVRALGRAAHDDPDNDVVRIDLDRLFDMTKQELRNESRFASLLQGEVPWVRQVGSDRKDSVSKRYKSDWSKADLIGHALKRVASYPPSSGGYRTILLDDAGSMREDFQQALRRTMERHHEAARFVIATRRSSGIISPIRSRCVPVAVRSPTPDEIATILETILAAEGADGEDAAVEYLSRYVDGDLRQAITLAQTAVTRHDDSRLTTDGLTDATDAVSDGRPTTILAAAENEEFTDARSTLDDLLDEWGGDVTLRELLDAIDDRYDGADRAAAYRLAGDVDASRAEGNSDRVQIGRLLASLGA